MHLPTGKVGQSGWPAKKVRPKATKGRIFGSSSERRFVVRKLTKSAIFVVCTVIGLWQSTKVAQMYFSFPVRLDIQIAHPDDIWLPAFSLCFSYFPLESKMAALNGDYHGPENHRNAEVYFDPKMAVEDYEKTSASQRDIIANCSIYDDNANGHVPCDTISAVKVQINQGYKCFTWFASDMLTDKDKIRKKYDLDDLVGNQWIRIKVFHLDLIRDLFGISVHYPDETVQPDLGSPSYLEVVRYWFPTSSVTKAMMTYSLTKSTLMQKPYESNCIDYMAVTGHRSRRHAIDNCTLDDFVADNQRWPWDMLATNETVTSDGQTWRLPFAGPGLGYSSDERTECSEKFRQPDCREDKYNIILKTVDYGPQQELEVVLYAPSGNEMILEEKSKHDLIEILSNVAGIISLWIGVSMVSIITPLIPYFAAWYQQLRHPKTKTDGAAGLKKAKMLQASQTVHLSQLYGNLTGSTKKPSWPSRTGKSKWRV
ncbi:hypothetical protein HDE_05695 [Halotydeus destructor]|nr:hypothetical protein HDE_05695 [Halotydeus destructor]